MPEQQWQPLSDGWESPKDYNGSHVKTTREGSQLMAANYSGYVSPMLVRMNHELPDNIRLCQLVDVDVDTPQPMDAPDGPGWWAFEGKLFDSTEDDDMVRMVVDVRESSFNRQLYASRAQNPYSWNVKTEMFGKWYRLTMPWLDGLAKE